MAVDSQLAKQENISGVKEILNGCLCCTLVGQLKAALQQILVELKPDRILVETSGSAFPAPIAWQLREMEQEALAAHADVTVHLDAIITVIDCINFRGYEDTSYTARMQAQYTDLILMNKSEHLSEREYDLVLDHVFTLNSDTPKYRIMKEKGVDPELIFGLDTKLFQLDAKSYSTTAAPQREDDKRHMDSEVDILWVKYNQTAERQYISTDAFEKFLNDKRLSKDSIYRIKGFVWLKGADQERAELRIVNYAFERFSWPLTLIEDTKLMSTYKSTVIDLTLMGISLTTTNSCGLREAAPWIKNVLIEHFGQPFIDACVWYDRDAGHCH